MPILNVWLREYVHSLLTPKRLGHLCLHPQYDMASALLLLWAGQMDIVFLDLPWKRKVVHRLFPGPRMLSLMHSLKGITLSACLAQTHPQIVSAWKQI